MMLSSFIQNYKLKNIKPASLQKEIHATTKLDKKQISDWLKTYKKTKNSFDHPYVQIARYYFCGGMPDEAIRFLKRFLKIKKDHAVYAWYLQNHYHSDVSTNLSLLKEHKQYASIFDKKIYPADWKKRFDKTPSKKLRIGYLCHFFVNSVSITTFIPFLQRHDPSKFETYCYDDGSTPEEFKSLATKWIDIRGLSDKEVADLILKDNIDILQEMNGFCAINRFGALAYRPAPIQINWYNHAGTTGLSYVDYVMGDRISVPDEDLPFYVEKVYRAPQFIAGKEFQGERFGAMLSESPYFKNGYITFCNFAGSHKCTVGTIALWCKVLHAVPNSILILKNTALMEPLIQQMFMSHFIKNGIGPDRVILEPGCDQVNLLKRYNDIDVMLDNVPVTGGSTIFEALMQGIPCITLMGKRWGSRHGASVLYTLNRPELVANSEAEYISIAKNIANNPECLRHYRHNLQREMLNSSLTNINTFYGNFETAYLTMWREWVNS